MFNSFPIPKPDSGGGSFVKSVQRGSTVMTGVTTNVAISAVDLTKSIVKIYTLGFNDSAPTPANQLIRAFISTATNLQLILDTFSSTAPPTVYWEVITFNNVKSLQTGIITASGFTAASATISAVDPNKSLLFISLSTTSTALFTREMMGAGMLVNSTTITVYPCQFSSTDTFRYYLIEFY